MAEFYQSLARSNGAAFHYISASPWQLYEPLAAFVRTNGFPAGTFALKAFRWQDKSFFSLFTNPEKYKSGVIEPLMKQFPKRKFILVGDSGERDPEIYAMLARQHPQQIARIFIRDVTGESAASERYVQAFRGVSPSRWQIFREPAELKIASE
jgi:phosphatidate phosphatase APP1